MNKYENPLCSRYASDKMQYIFSPDFKFSTWRKLWVYLAESEKELGLDFITQDQIDAMKENIYNIDYEVANNFEKELRHDVMAHVHAFSKQVPIAKPIIHLGATSAYVGDNTDLIQIKEALILIRARMLNVILELRNFAMKYKAVPTLGYTHFQAAQLTTVGKRASLWLKSLMYDLDEIDRRIENLEFRGVKGTTGTQASFRELFNNDFEKVKALDELVTKKAGFSKRQEVSGQTYDRKQDSLVLQALAGIASSSHKFANDFRLLQNLKELEEPFEKNQIGSSAMAYKRNPMRCERISALAKFAISEEINGHLVHSTQWFERTLDDSANKRLSYPQSFLAVDAILIIWHNVIKNAVVYEKIIEANIKKELPFMATENIIMRAVKNGMDRQDVHEIIRELSMLETKSIKLYGNENKLIERILEDGRLNISKDELEDILDAKKYIGFANNQVEDYIKTVDEILEKHKENMIKDDTELSI